MRFTYKYKASHDERVEVGFLAKASPEEVARWLREHHTAPPKGIYGEPLDLYKDDGRRLLEYVLSRRNHPLIDHALARYGYSHYSIQKAYDRGDASTRSAATSNIRGGIALRQASDILRTGKYSQLRALLQNKWLSGEFIEQLLRRKEKYSDLSDERFALIVSAITGNERLNSPYQSLYMDGYDEYRYHLPFHAAWDLTKSVSADQGWAAVLWNLLGSTLRPYKFDDWQAAVERWSIDIPPKKPGKWFSRSPSFFVRSHLYDLKEADNSLLESDDAAARVSFYRRFAPSTFRDWPRFLKIDGEEFTNAALQNSSLWQSEEQRQALSQVCWATPDEHHMMDVPNEFRSLEERHRQKNPEWFNEQVDSPLGEAVKEVLKRLEKLESELQTIPRKRSLF
jgi:hypothetical protein